MLRRSLSSFAPPYLSVDSSPSFYALLSLPVACPLLLQAARSNVPPCSFSAIDGRGLCAPFYFVQQHLEIALHTANFLHYSNERTAGTKAQLQERRTDSIASRSRDAQR